MHRCFPCGVLGTRFNRSIHVTGHTIGEGRRSVEGGFRKKGASTSATATTVDGYGPFASLCCMLQRLQASSWHLFFSSTVDASMPFHGRSALGLIAHVNALGSLAALGLNYLVLYMVLLVLTGLCGIVLGTHPSFWW